MPAPETDATAQSDAKLVAALNASIKLHASIESEGIDLAIDQVPDAWWSGNPGVLHGMQMTFRGKKATGRPLALLLWLHLASDDCLLAIVAWRGEAHLEGGAGRPPAVPPPAGGSPAAQAQNRAVNDRLEIPAPDEATAAAWRELAEALRETTQWAAGLDRQIGGLMDGVLPLRVVGDVLEVTGAQAVASFIEERAVPVFDRFAASRRFGRVRWVPRDVAAQITTTGRTAA